MNSLLTTQFEQQFHTSPTFLVRAPGRVNLIGEHTDYNEGFVLPMAIERAIHIALRPRNDRRVIVRSLEYNETAEFSLDNLQKGKGWLEYIKGSAWAMREEGWPLSGWDGVITGDIPRGAGLSSSAAVEVAAVRAFAAASDRSTESSRQRLEPDPVKIALLGQKAENCWVGVNCGLMDQMASSASRTGHALFLDCRSLEYQLIPLPAGVSVAILDTSTRRGLVDSAYNERRSQCEAAARFFGVRALRDVNEAGFRFRADALEEVTRRRARHIVTENERVCQAVDAMRRGDAITLGHLLDASHASLRDDFEVSSEALNAIVEVARRQPGCYGARMTGAGFGGCAVALVEQERGPEFGEAVTEQFLQTTGLKPAVYITQAAEGASTVCLTI
jgi:galactokinase